MNSNFMARIGMEPYMGGPYIDVRGIYKILLNQLSNMEVNKNDKIKIYGFLVALLDVIVISFIYSKVLTKPLIKMRSIAKNISKCNFKDKYEVKSEDELGELGGELNLISSNLEESLNDLKNANSQLKS